MALFVGIVILASGSLMWFLPGTDRIFAALGISALGFGALGWWDDHHSLRVRRKLLVEFAVGVIVVWLNLPISTRPNFLSY